MHFAVVSVKMQCLLVQYIYRSSVADGDVKKRGDSRTSQTVDNSQNEKTEDRDKWTGRVKRNKDVPAFCVSMQTVNYRLKAYAEVGL